jgi:hypothetical protein
MIQAKNHMTVAYAGENCQENSSAPKQQRLGAFKAGNPLFLYDIERHAEREHGVRAVIGMDGDMLYQRTVPVGRVDTRLDLSDGPRGKVI